jgi:hypothetical protein
VLRGRAADRAGGPEDRDSREYLFWAVVYQGYPAAFTNPLIFDRDGGGYKGVE